MEKVVSLNPGTSVKILSNIWTDSFQSLRHPDTD